MEALRTDNQALSHEFTEFMSHTTTLLTKLQVGSDELQIRSCVAGPSWAELLAASAQGQFAQLLASSRAPQGAVSDPRGKLVSSLAVDQLLPPDQAIEGGRSQPVARPPSSVPMPSQRDAPANTQSVPAVLTASQR